MAGKPPISQKKHAEVERTASAGDATGALDHGAPPAPICELAPRRGRFAPAVDRAKGLIAWVKRHERSLSAFGMVAGFVSDNFMFRRIDLPNTQVLFVAYLTLAAGSVTGLHFLERRAREGRMYARFRAFLPMATQFALGSLWSAFLVFYSRSAVVMKSWPYLAVLTAFFIGNEVLKRYHARLVFTVTLFFFALFTYAAVTVPLYTHTMGKLTFVASGAAALLVLVLFLYILKAVNRAQYAAVRAKIGLGVAAVYVLMNVFYFTNTLPPLPLALVNIGVFHDVKKTGAVYTATTEPEPWDTALGMPPILHVPAGQPVYVYSAVFAPVKMSLSIVHRWHRFDPKTQHWQLKSKVSFPINGGRDGGYRGYTIKHNPEPGDWRVDIDTSDGHLIGRVTFKVERSLAAPVETPQILK